MPNYVIGDIQGCYKQLCALLKKISYDSSRDQIWLVGDLVNRGPKSLEVLEWAYQSRKNVKCVLGNHDLHLLAIAKGLEVLRNKDTLKPIIKSKKVNKYVSWIRNWPFVYYLEKFDVAIVHAGIYPFWTLDQALCYSQEVQTILRSKDYKTLLKSMYGANPDIWSKNLSGMDRYRFIINAFTRMRFCDKEGRLNFSEKSNPQSVVNHHQIIPWFSHEHRNIKDSSIVFGHWATLQTDSKLDPRYNVFHVDTGCVWGGKLTALRLEDKKVFKVAGL